MDEIDAISHTLEDAMARSMQSLSPPKPDDNPFSMKTYLAASQIMQSTQLKNPTKMSSVERARVVNAARLKAKQRTEIVTKATDRAIDVLQRPVRVPEILGSMQSTNGPGPTVGQQPVRSVASDSKQRPASGRAGAVRGSGTGSSIAAPYGSPGGRIQPGSTRTPPHGMSRTPATAQHGAGAGGTGSPQSPRMDLGDDTSPAKIYPSGAQAHGAMSRVLGGQPGYAHGGHAGRSSHGGSAPASRRSSAADSFKGKLLNTGWPAAFGGDQLPEENPAQAIGSAARGLGLGRDTTHEQQMASASRRRSSSGGALDRTDNPLTAFSPAPVRTALFQGAEADDQQYGHAYGHGHGPMPGPGPYMAPRQGHASLFTAESATMTTTVQRHVTAYVHAGGNGETASAGAQTSPIGVTTEMEMEGGGARAGGYEEAGAGRSVPPIHVHITLPKSVAGDGAGPRAGGSRVPSTGPEARPPMASNSPFAARVPVPGSTASNAGILTNIAAESAKQTALLKSMLETQAHAFTAQIGVMKAQAEAQLEWHQQQAALQKQAAEKQQLDALLSASAHPGGGSAAKGPRKERPAPVVIPIMASPMPMPMPMPAAQAQGTPVVLAGLAGQTVIQPAPMSSGRRSGRAAPIAIPIVVTHAQVPQQQQQTQTVPPLGNTGTQTRSRASSRAGTPAMSPSANASPAASVQGRGIDVAGHVSGAPSPAAAQQLFRPIAGPEAASPGPEAEAPVNEASMPSSDAIVMADLIRTMWTDALGLLQDRAGATTTGVVAGRPASAGASSRRVSSATEGQGAAGTRGSAPSSPASPSGSTHAAAVADQAALTPLAQRPVPTATSALTDEMLLTAITTALLKHAQEGALNNGRAVSESVSAVEDKVQELSLVVRAAQAETASAKAQTVSQGQALGKELAAVAMDAAAARDAAERAVEVETAWKAAIAHLEHQLATATATMAAELAQVRDMAEGAAAAAGTSPRDTMGPELLALTNAAIDERTAGPLMTMADTVRGLSERLAGAVADVADRADEAHAIAEAAAEVAREAVEAIQKAREAAPVTSPSLPSPGPERSPAGEPAGTRIAGLGDTLTYSVGTALSDESLPEGFVGEDALEGADSSGELTGRPKLNPFIPRASDYHISGDAGVLVAVPESMLGQGAGELQDLSVDLAELSAGEVLLGPGPAPAHGQTVRLFPLTFPAPSQ